MSVPHGPLQGVKVVSCSTAQAGTVPWMLMADLGADVIKIESPQGGDPSRRMTVLPGMGSTFFEANNRGVKSVTLNLKSAEGREILRKLVAKADIFGQNFRPGAAEKNGFGWDDLRKVNPKLVYVSISGYGPDGPHAHLPGTDSMAQALGGIAEAYSTAGQKMKTGVVSVADETCAILAFGGALAALTHARRTGVGQKIDLSLLGGQIRLMGWTLQTAMWRDRNPVTGQARVTGTRERPGISASFDDRDGKPLVFQITGPEDWKDAMMSLGFHERLEKAGFRGPWRHHRQRFQAHRASRHSRHPVRDRDARGLGRQAAGRRHRLGADQHAARSLQRSRRRGQRLRHRGRVSEARQEAEGTWHAVEVLGDAGPARHCAGTGRAQRCRPG
jgi:crotonobetainyl-CoA:carnitine CoA-transferase CaiB-like acyl-CoA transferase